jgi:hypothetical protein
MKLAINKKTSSRIFNRAPINFWEPEKVEEDSTTKNNFYQDSICHEVKYDPTDKKSDTYKKYIKPFSYGTPEQWLKFMEDLNVIVIRGNGLDKNGSACFNLTRSSLKGEALCVFNDKAAEQEEETKDTHIQCLRAIAEQVFPKENPLSKQKTYMRNHVFLHLSDRTISEFCARWIKLNNYLDAFPPFEPNQHFTENETKEIFYNIIPKHWQSYLQRDKFDIVHCSVHDFLEIMEHYQITDNIDPLLKPKDQSKANKNETNKLTEKSNDKKRKAKSKKNDSDVPAPKKSCLIHGEDSCHMMDECQTMRKQAYRMKEAWKNTSQAECSHQKHEREQQKQKEQNKLHEMIMKEVQQSMQDMFKQLHQRHHSDDDSDMDESHQQESMDNITVSECFNLSDLRQPATKRLRLNILPQSVQRSLRCD